MSDDYKVGYGKPPKAGQFKKGESGNPKGRKKGIKNLATDLKEELRETLPVREGNRTRKITKQRALLKSLAAKGLQGDAKSSAAILNLVLKLFGGDVGEANAASVTQEDEAILDSYFERAGIPKVKP